MWYIKYIYVYIYIKSSIYEPALSGYSGGEEVFFPMLQSTLKPHYADNSNISPTRV